MKDELKFRHVSLKLKQRLNKAYGSKVRISRHDYKVTWCSELVWHGKGICGLCDPGAKRIYVVADSVAGALDTLIHEMAHAEFASSGLRYTTLWSPDLEEQVVELMSQMIASSFHLRRRA